MDRAVFIDAMRRAAASVTVVTTNGVAGRAGVTVSAMCSASADPPALLACIHQESTAVPAILGNGNFCVNILAEDQRHIAEWFAGLRREAAVDKFDCASWRDLGEYGLALDGALAVFGCRIAASHRVGSHFVLIGHPGIITRGDGLPLIYADRRFGVPLLQMPSEPPARLSPN